METTNNKNKKQSFTAKKVQTLKNVVKSDISILETNKKTYFLVIVIALVFLVLCCWGVFFIFVKGPEEVLVPNVVGKPLEEALFQMQGRELYQKLLLKYTDNPDDKGIVLEQNPQPGSIVKAGRRINLTVSRGVVLDKIEDYTGKIFEEEEIRLQALFAGEQKQIITFDPPIYKSDIAPIGTILSQEPPPDTKITSPIKVKVVVSKGPAYENTKAPDIIGKNINDMLSFMSTSPLIFDFSAHIATQEEAINTITNCQSFETEYIPNYTRVQVDIALSSGKTAQDMLCGIFSYTTQVYPYPVAMELVAKPQDQDEYTIVKLRHTGGKITIPYSVPENTVLQLKIVDKVVAKTTIN